MSQELHSPLYGTNVQGEIQTPMDVLANDICIRCLKGTVPVMASEEVEEIRQGDLKDGNHFRQSVCSVGRKIGRYLK